MRCISGTGVACFFLTFISSTTAAENTARVVDVQGRIMVDYALFDGVHNKDHLASEWVLRRARIGLKHKSGKDWKAELELNIDHASEEVDITDGYVQYNGWRIADVTFGRMKQAFGLEESTSSRYISTMERSVVTEAFAPGRSFGVQLSEEGDRHSWNVGLYQASEDQYGLDGYALTGRITFSPINVPGSVTHFGLSGSSRDMLGETYKINESLEIDAADTVVESRRIAADRVSQVAVEGAWVAQRFSLQGEWMQQQITEIFSEGRAGPMAEFSGYYVLASYFLTGESRVYDRGSFGEVKPSGDGGAWELVARYSSIDLMSLNEGVNADISVLGLNYYATGRARLMLNFSRSNNRSSDAEESGRGNAVSFRVQYEF